MSLTLTDTQKHKYLNYIESKRLSSPFFKSSLTSKRDLQDLFSLSLEDIISKLESVEFYRNSTDEQKKTLKENLIYDFFSDLIQAVLFKIAELELDYGKERDLTLILENSETPQAFFDALTFFTSISHELSIEVLRTIATTYVKKCNELYLIADEEILNIIKDN